VGKTKEARGRGGLQTCSAQRRGMLVKSPASEHRRGDSLAAEGLNRVADLILGHWGNQDRSSRNLYLGGISLHSQEWQSTQLRLTGEKNHSRAGQNVPLNSPGAGPSGPQTQGGEA